jgi:DNA-directed RNA polymerase specialized sigma24 family protein
MLGIVQIRVTFSLRCVLLLGVGFEEFAKTEGGRLRAGLVATYGPDTGSDASAEAMAYAWEHWDRISTMNNAVGYLYRVGQTSALKARRKQGFLPVPPPEALPHFEPGLLPALEALTEQQRVAVLLVHAFGWKQTDAAKLLEISPSSIRTHLKRGLKKLALALEVESHV